MSELASGISFAPDIELYGHCADTCVYDKTDTCVLVTRLCYL
jgi:hypothetical protein